MRGTTPVLNVTNGSPGTKGFPRGSVDQERTEAQWADWMRLGLAGDEHAYRTLLQALSDWLRRFARTRLARAGCGDIDVEDTVQETLLAIHLKRHTWRSTEPIGPWISAIGRNKLIDLLRRRGRRAELPLDDALEATLEARSFDEGATQDVERVLDSLGERQRAIVRLVSIEGHSARTAAQQLGMSEGALRVALHRSLRMLAARLRSESE
jgi:RNA polymerase sigma factor (sigma-70 family)